MIRVSPGATAGLEKECETLYHRGSSRTKARKVLVSKE